MFSNITIKNFLIIFIFINCLQFIMVETNNNKYELKIKYIYGSDMKNSVGELITELNNFEYYVYSFFVNLILTINLLISLNLFIGNINRFIEKNKIKKYKQKYKR